MLKIYQINYLSPTTEISSYSLFGAFCWGYRLLKGEKSLVDFLIDFKKKPSFLLSSPLPVVRSKTLFPKPLLKMNYEENVSLEEKSKRKKYKKAKYITEEVLKDIINGKIKYQNQLMQNKDEYIVCSGVILKKEEEKDLNQEKDKEKKKQRNILLARNLINRQKNISENLFIELGLLKDKEIFMVRYLNPAIIETFEEVLGIIQSLGLGGNKNIGWGKVAINEIDKSKINLGFLDSNFTNKKDFFISIAPIIPTENIDFDSSLYDVYMFKSFSEGSFEESLVKSKVAYLREGSLVKTRNKDSFCGQLKVVNQNPDIYQYGLEFPIYLRWSYE